MAPCSVRVKYGETTTTLAVVPADAQNRQG